MISSFKVTVDLDQTVGGVSAPNNLRINLFRVSWNISDLPATKLCHDSQIRRWIFSRWSLALDCSRLLFRPHFNPVPPLPPQSTPHTCSLLRPGLHNHNITRCQLKMGRVSWSDSFNKVLKWGGFLLSFLGVGRGCCSISSWHFRAFVVKFARGRGGEGRGDTAVFPYYFILCVCL